MNELNIKFRKENWELRIMISSKDLLITTYWKDLKELKKNLKEAIEGVIESIEEKEVRASVINLSNIFNFWILNPKVNAINL